MNIKAFALMGLLLASTQASAVILDMITIFDDQGIKVNVEKSPKDFIDPATQTVYKQSYVQIKGLSLGNTSSFTVFMNCENGTWGEEVPTTEDIPTGTVGYHIYEEICE